jgi:DNA-binding transcriptional LysR family regulator
MLNLDEIFSFIEVAKAQGFSEASRVTRLPKSTLSRHVQNLEERLALHLFHRSTRRLKLTQAGEDFFRKAQSLTEQFENLERQFQTQNEKAEGLIRITCPVEVGAFILPPIFRAFKTEHPLVEFDLLLSDDITNLIESRIDVALRGGVLKDSSIICRKVFESQFKVYGHPSLKKDLKTVSLIDYTNRPFEKLEFQIKGKKFVFGQKPVLRSNSLRMNAEWAAQGLGACALPSFMGEVYESERKLVCLSKDLGTVIQPMHLLYLSQSHLPLRVRLFIDYLTKSLA